MLRRAAGAGGKILASPCSPRPARAPPLRARRHERARDPRSDARFSLSACSSDQALAAYVRSILPAARTSLDRGSVACWNPGGKRRGLARARSLARRAAEPPPLKACSSALAGGLFVFSCRCRTLRRRGGARTRLPRNSEPIANTRSEAPRRPCELLFAPPGPSPDENRARRGTAIALAPGSPP